MVYQALDSVCPLFHEGSKVNLQCKLGAGKTIGLSLHEDIPTLCQGRQHSGSDRVFGER